MPRDCCRLSSEKSIHLPYLAQRWTPGWLRSSRKKSSRRYDIWKTRIFILKARTSTDNNIWLGAADDVILRKRGVEFVDGTAPGFAAILGAAPTNEIATKIAQELQQKNLYVFMAGRT